MLIVANKMTRLSFGLFPAQSGALFCLEKALLDNEINASQTTIMTALKSFCVDDELFSFASEAELISFYNQIFHFWLPVVFH